MTSIDRLYKIAENHLRKNLPLALYKKPACDTLCLMLQKNMPIYKYNDNFKTGFIVSKAFQKEKYIIPSKKSDVFFARLDSPNRSLPKTYQRHHCEDKQAKDKQKYLSLVKKALDEINAKSLEKVVISRYIELTQENLNPLSAFDRLAKHHQNAFVYMWHHPKLGTWAGATPELLISTHANSFITTALASTKDTFAKSSPKWTTKEKKEQEIVSRYIAKNIAAYAETVKYSIPKTILAGHLWHLKTDIYGTLLEGNYWEDIANILSPTPAVCGTPKDKAMRFIIENESYDRAFYTGLVGEVISETQADIFVNIRCMEINQKAIKVFIGAGIIDGSEPEKEWIETNEKSKTILNII